MLHSKATSDPYMSKRPTVANAGEHPLALVPADDTHLFDALLKPYAVTAAQPLDLDAALESDDDDALERARPKLRKAKRKLPGLHLRALRRRAEWTDVRDASANRVITVAASDGKSARHFAARHAEPGAPSSPHVQGAAS